MVPCQRWASGAWSARISEDRNYSSMPDAAITFPLHENGVKGSPAAHQILAIDGDVIL